jgi:hypothetical protein
MLFNQSRGRERIRLTFSKIITPVNISLILPIISNKKVRY